MPVIDDLNEERIRTALIKGSVSGCSSSTLQQQLNNRHGSYRRAAVLLLLLQGENGWELLFTRRTETVQDHKGQVSFPGGSYEPGDTSLQETALREAFEEIGLEPDQVRILGELDPMLTRTSFLVTPVIGTTQGPLTFTLSPEEVGRVFTIPLGWLAEAGHYFERAYYRPDIGASELLVFFEEYDGEIVWGITARLVVSLLRVLNLVSE